MRSVLAGVLREASTYVDVGTNRGQLLGDAVRIAPLGAHVAFEPIPELAAVVRERFPAVRCHQAAVSFEPGTETFCHFRTMDGWSGLRRREEISDDIGSPEMITVEVVTLDEALKETKPSVLKIDVEGGELNVLRGASRVLSQDQPLVLFEHEHDPAALYGATSEAIWDLLSETGYRIFTVTGMGPFSRAPFAQARDTVNWLAVPR